jgi:1-acyl-sn-glycerol-3-phosphate acyltransferase
VKMFMQRFLYSGGKILLNSYARLFLDFDLLFLSPLPGGPKLFTCNHPTSTDPFYLSLAINEPLYLLTTSDLFENPITGYLLQKAGHIRVQRDRGQAYHILNQTVSYLKAGKNVAIFPEGSLSPEDGDGFAVCEPQSGAARIALASGVPVIPVGVCPDKNRVIRRQFEFSRGSVEGRLALRGAYSITVGNPLSFEGDAGYRPLIDRTGQQIISEIRKLTQMSRDRIHSQRIHWNSVFSLKPFLHTNWH